MTSPPPIPGTTPEDPDSEDSLPKRSGQLKLLISVFALTAAADFFLFKISPGLGTAIFCLLLWTGLKMNRPTGTTSWKEWTLYGFMISSAIQIAIEPSFYNWVMLFSLTIYGSGHFLHRHLSPYWRRAMEGLLGLIHIPLAFSNLWHGLRAGKQSTQTVAFKGAMTWGRRWVNIIFPALIITIIFLILFSRGNAIMGDGINAIVERCGEWLSEFRFPSFSRIIFWMVIGFALLSLLGKAPLSPIVPWFAKRLPGKLKAPADSNIAIWQTRILLLAVNAIFFAANSVDVIYLWMKTELPVDINFSEFVHQGVNNLIICVILAAAVLLLCFQQDKKTITARGQRFLAFLWIGQNLLLVSSVLLRLKLYVDAYQLSLARLQVVYFLLLVVIGFILLGAKIGRDRKFTWLINSNILAVFFLFFTLQFLNDRDFVARFNCEQAKGTAKKGKVLDVTYLFDLGPAAWPSLRQVADNPSQFGKINSITAEEHLKKASQNEGNRMESVNWKSWQYRRSICRRSLPGFRKEGESKKED